MLKDLAAQNLKKHLRENSYPGRGIVIGRNERLEWIQVYWIMGRSANSRNRILVYERGLLRTQAANPDKVVDPSLIIYNAMRASGRRFIVSNGVQTDTIYNKMELGQPFPETLLNSNHEPDGPNFTPRISGCVDLSQTEAQAWLSTIKVSPFDRKSSEHHFFHYASVKPGYGYAITTYRGDGVPLPSFVGAPFLLSLQGSADRIATTLWSVLDAENKISLAVRWIDPCSAHSDVVVINRYA